MRLLKVLSTILVAVIAVLVGLFTAIAVTVGGAVVYLFGRLFGRLKTSRVREQPPPRSPASKTSDVIDITATEITEVPADPTFR